MDDHVPGDAWTDERLDAAFRAIASRRAPGGLEARVLAGLDERPPRRWLAVPGLALGGVAAVVLAAVLGSSLLGGLRGALTGTIAVRDGEPGTKVLDAGEFSFAFPAGWSAVDSQSGGSSGGSSIAVLGTLPVDPRCGSGHVDVNCVYEQRLEPGTVRGWVFTRSYRTGSILDEPAFEGGWEALTVDGMPARLDVPAIQSDDFYRSDLALTLSVARPAGFGHVVTIELLARDPGADAARAAMDTIIASFRFADPPPALPPDEAAGLEVARRVLAESDEVLRQSIGEGSGATPYSCQPADPGVVAEAELGYDFDSSLGSVYPARCSWTVERDGDRFWRLELHADWDVGDHPNEGTETIWVDAMGTVMGRRAEHLSATPTAPPETEAPAARLPAVDEALGLDVLTIDEALAGPVRAADGREFAVRGWLTSRAMTVRCAYTIRESPLLPRCGEDLVYLLRHNQTIPRTTDGVPPIGPLLNPLIRGSVDVVGLGPEPLETILVGHVGDARAAFCPADLRAQCEAAFIVDRVLPASGAAAGDPMPWLSGIEPPRAAAAAWAHLAAIGMPTGEQALSIGLVDSTELATIQPALTAADGIDAGPVWIVEVLGGPGEDPAQRTTIILPDTAIDLRRTILTFIVDGEVLRRITIID